MCKGLRDAAWREIWITVQRICVVGTRSGREPTWTCDLCASLLLMPSPWHTWPAQGQSVTAGQGWHTQRNPFFLLACISFLQPFQDIHTNYMLFNNRNLFFWQFWKPVIWTQCSKHHIGYLQAELPVKALKEENIVSSSFLSCENSLTCGHAIPICLHLHSVFLSVYDFAVDQISLFPNTIKIFVIAIRTHSYNSRHFSFLKLLNVSNIQSIYV